LASNDKKLRTRKDLEGGSGLFLDALQAFVWRYSEKARISLLTVAGVQARVQTRHLPIASLQRQCSVYIIDELCKNKTANKRISMSISDANCKQSIWKTRVIKKKEKNWSTSVLSY
jgi:hypothetical protein